MSATTTFPTIPRAAGGALIASPSSALREQVLDRLNGRWRPVEQALGGAEALLKLEEREWQVLFLDRRLPEIQVVLLDSDVAFPASGGGQTSSDFCVEGDGRSAGDRSPGNRSLENREREKESEYETLPGMIGRSAAMQRVYRLVQLVAPRTTTVLIVGPTGSGKELVARALHVLSPRAAKPFVAVNCAAIPEALLESELFGYARGAFTGAVQAQVGRIPTAHGGTLFLDEISELPFGMQAKLLRFLEQKEVQRLGTAEVTRVDVRVIAASNVDLAGRAGRGEFREDLFYRLSAFPLELPPLTERRVDIVPLAEHFLACMAAAMSGRCPHLSEEAVRILEAHPWKGNVRELQHVMERASILVEDGDTVLSEHLYFPFQHSLLQTGPHVLFVHQASKLRRVLAASLHSWPSSCRCSLTVTFCRPPA
jgi:DNA-binding NtrC family response regulator